MTQISKNPNDCAGFSATQIRPLNSRSNNRPSNRSTSSFPIVNRLATVAMIGAMISVISLAGCDRTYMADADSKNLVTESVTKPAQPKTTETTSVAVEKLTNLTSPAEATKKVDADSTPGEVCQTFMKLLQSGDRIAAENLLTRTALTVTTRAGLQLEPMGGPTSVFNVNEILYATNKKKLAQVECSIVDKVDGESFEMEMAWLVRKHASGWRISGVMLELEPGKTKDLLSFENALDVNKIKALAGAEIIDDQSRQAKSQDSAIK